MKLIENASRRRHRPGTVRRHRRHRRPGPDVHLRGGHQPARQVHRALRGRRICAALCHGVGLLRYARLSNGEPLVAGKTVTGFANVEEDFTDQSVWDAGALAPAPVMPWRIEDELKALGANFIQAGCGKRRAVTAT